MAEIVIKLVNGELAGKTMQQINKEVGSASVALKKAEVGTKDFVDASMRLDKAKNLQADMKKQIEGTSKASGILKQEFGGILNQIPGFSAISGAMSSAKAGIGGLTSGFGLLKGAIAATGIGLLVIAFATLVGWFTKTDEGATMLSGIMKGMGIVMDKVFGKLIDGAKALAGYFTGEKSIKQGLIDLVEFIGNNLLNRVKAFVVIWQGIRNLDLKTVTDGVIQLGTGITNATDKMADFANSVADAVKEGIDFEKQLDAIEDRARALSVINAKNEAEVSRLLLQSKDVALSYEERIALLDKASAIELANHQQQVVNARALEALRAKEIADNASRNIQTDELDQALADAQIARINLEKESLNLQEKIENRRSALLERRATELAKLNADEVKAFKKLEDDKIAAMDEGRDKDIAALRLGLMRQIDELNSNSPLYAEQLAAAQELARQKKAEINAKWDTKEAGDKMAALELDLATDQNALNEQWLAKQITEDQFTALTLQRAMDFQAKKLALIKASLGSESAEYQKANAEYLEMQTATAKQSVDIKKQEHADTMAAMQGSLQVLGNFFGTLGSMQEEGSKSAKNFAIAQAIISSITGAINAYSSTASIPFVGPILAPIAAGLALAAGIANVNKIRSTPVPKMNRAKKELGGPLFGPRHRDGGITIEAEGGEFIMSRRAVGGIGMDNLTRMNNQFAAGGPVNPFDGSRGAMGRGDGQSTSGQSPIFSTSLENKIEMLAVAMDKRIDRIEVVNDVTKTKRGIDVLNKLKSDADV